MSTVLYHLAVAALFTHEMDAVMHHEWRGLAVIGGLPDVTAYPLFLAAHFPAFVVILWLSHHRSAMAREWFRLGLSTFLVVHAGMHFRASGQETYEFQGLLPNVFIYGAAAFGAAYVWFDPLVRGRVP